MSSCINRLQQQCRGLRLSSLADSIGGCLVQAEELQSSYLQFAEALIDSEVKGRNGKRIALNRRKACFPVEKRLEDFDYQQQPHISKREVNQLLDFGFIVNRSNLIFIGPPGVGKTHLTVGIGLKAIEAGYKALFQTAAGLSEMLEMAEMKGRLKQQIALLCKFDLLILDELGYLPLNRQSNYTLFQLVHAMYEYRSIIITTNKDFTQWGEFFIDHNIAVPVIDRLIHHSKIFMLGGESYKLKSKLSG